MRGLHAKYFSVCKLVNLTLYNLIIDLLFIHCNISLIASHIFLGLLTVIQV